MLYTKKKHIPIKYDFLWEKVSNQTSGLEYVPRKEKIANIYKFVKRRNYFMTCFVYILFIDTKCYNDKANKSQDKRMIECEFSITSNIF